MVNIGGESEVNGGRCKMEKIRSDPCTITIWMSVILVLGGTTGTAGTAGAAGAAPVQVGVAGTFNIVFATGNKVFPWQEKTRVKLVLLLRMQQHYNNTPNLQAQWMGNTHEETNILPRSK